MMVPVCQLIKPKTLEGVFFYVKKKKKQARTSRWGHSPSADSLILAELFCAIH